MERSVYILQHVPGEGPGLLAGWLKRNRIPYQQIRLYAGERAPRAWSRVRALVVLGGPMNVYEEARYPFLRWEDGYIREALRRKVPFLGICLGAQLLAKALDARVKRAAAPEIGWSWVRLRPEARKGGFFGSLRASRLRVLQWHGDTFDLPRGASHLASSALVPNQAFAWRGFAFALQFHVEADGRMLKAWFKNEPQGPSIWREFARDRAAIQKRAEALFKNFFDPAPGASRG